MRCAPAAWESADHMSATGCMRIQLFHNILFPFLRMMHHVQGVDGDCAAVTVICGVRGSGMDVRPEQELHRNLKCWDPASHECDRYSSQ
jgi:alpha-galactosidase